MNDVQLRIVRGRGPSTQSQNLRRRGKRSPKRSAARNSGGTRGCIGSSISNVATSTDGAGVPLGELSCVCGESVELEAVAIGCDMVADE